MAPYGYFAKYPFSLKLFNNCCSYFFMEVPWDISNVEGWIPLNYSDNTFLGSKVLTRNQMGVKFRKKTVQYCLSILASSCIGIV